MSEHDEGHDPASGDRGVPGAADRGAGGWSNPVTIRTIAERVGVHPSTVSRALHGSTNPDGARTRRIREVADALGYRPHPGAASLRTRRSLAVGVTVSRLTDVVMATLYEAIERAARESGYQTVVAASHDDLAEQRRVCDFILGRRVDGMIVCDAHRDGAHVAWLRDRGVPFVLALRHAGGHPAVTADDALGGRLVADHLAALGHRDVAVLAGHPYSSAFAGRARGCLDGLRAHGIEVASGRVVTGPVDAATGYRQMRELLAADGAISAVFAVNDDSALGALRALREHGRTPGSDVALVGYNDVPTAATAELTTVRNPLTELGETALGLLLELLAGGEISSVRLRPELIVRGSSAGLAAGGRVSPHA